MSTKSWGSQRPETGEPAAQGMIWECVLNNVGTQSRPTFDCIQVNELELRQQRRVDDAREAGLIIAVGLTGPLLIGKLLTGSLTGGLVTLGAVWAVAATGALGPLSAALAKDLPKEIFGGGNGQ